MKQLIAIRIGIFYFFMFTIYGGFIPFIGAYLELFGLKAVEISVILATPAIIRILMSRPLGWLADHMVDRRLALMIYGLVPGIIFCGLFYADSFWSLFIITGLAACFFSGIIPVTDAVALIFVRRYQLAFGKIRLWGSIGFMAAAASASLFLETYGLVWLPWIIIASLLTTSLLTRLLPPPAQAGTLKRYPSGNNQIKASPKVAKSRLKNYMTWPLVLILIASALVQASHAMMYNFSFLLLEHLDISVTYTGILWAIAVAAEILFLLFAQRISTYVSNFGLIVLGSLAAILRWGLYSYADSLEFLLTLQLLHAFSFAATYLGTVQMIAVKIPERHAAEAQGFYATASGITTGASILLAGQAWVIFVNDGFWMMSIIAMLAFLLLWISTLFSRYN